MLIVPGLRYTTAHSNREDEMAAEPCKVLVVDDNHDAADAAVMLLHIWGHEAVAAYSGLECLALAKTFDPDVVLMDIGLPGKDGFRVKEELEQHCPGVKVIALSGFTQADIVRRSREEGFTDYLIKPAGVTELKHVVDRQCAASKEDR
jgi:CheY-like chemotaxis protein